jgi:methylmalonyl-CoA mutase
MTDRSSFDLKLAAEFPPATRDAWRALVDGVLKGTSYERRLVHATYDQIPIQPLYERAEATVAIVGRAAGKAWSILQRMDHPDPFAANQQALDDLAQGAGGLALVCAGSTGAHRYGLAGSPQAFGSALAGLKLDRITIELDPGQQAHADALAELVQRRGAAAAALDIRFGLAPLSLLALHGRSPLSWADTAPRFAATIQQLARKGFKGPFAAADARLIHHAGGSEAQELAFALTSALAYLRTLEAGGVTLDAARRMIYFRLVADSDQFLTLAKFRALRLLWARIETACGLTPVPTCISAETAWRTMTQRDPHANVLRATIAVLAAGLGGADAITVLPFTLARGLPDPQARRLARNTQSILVEEAHLARVTDPAAGSGGIEDLTDRLCAVAWKLLQDIEAAGGAAAALEQGLIQRHVAATRREREAAVAHRTEALIGTSDYPDLNESSIAVLDVAPVNASEQSGTHAIAALPSCRLAEPFERLRDASDLILAASGRRPSVFLANLGTLAEFGAHATFAKNLFEAGGIAAIDNDGFASRDDLVRAFRQSGASIACLCGTTDSYAAEAVATATALAGAGASMLLLAGDPGPREAELRQAGIAHYAYTGCDMLAVLAAVFDLAAIDLSLEGARS